MMVYRVIVDGEVRFTTSNFALAMDLIESLAPEPCRLEQEWIRWHDTEQGKAFFKEQANG